MPETVQALEGQAQLQYKLVLKDNKTLVFNPNVVTLYQAELRESMMSTGFCTHTFTTNDPAFVESVKQVMADADPVLEFRLGFGTPTKMYWLPWQQHIIVCYSSKFEGIANTSGHTIVFKTANDLLRIERSNKVVARKGKISDIVKAIAAENKLDCVVEETSGDFIYYQTFIDDTRFVIERLLPRAVNTVGHGGYYFFIRDNVLHFHTPDYQSTVRLMDYYSVYGTSLNVVDRSQEPVLWDTGLAGLRIIQYDPKTGETKEVSSLPEKALKLSDNIYQYSSVPNGQYTMSYHLSDNGAAEAAAIAQYQYQRARQQTFVCTVELEKTITIRHGDLLNVSMTQQSDRASSHSGYYLVTEALHIVRKQSVHSVYTLQRGEFRGQDQSLTVQNAQNQLVPESQAPGYFPSIPEVQSSERTRGAGKQSSATTYAIVADASTGKPV
jgi:hypothetical protein